MGGLLSVAGWGGGGAKGRVGSVLPHCGRREQRVRTPKICERLPVDSGVSASATGLRAAAPEGEALLCACATRGFPHLIARPHRPAAGGLACAAGWSQSWRSCVGRGGAGHCSPWWHRCFFLGPRLPTEKITSTVRAQEGLLGGVGGRKAEGRALGAGCGGKLGFQGP